MLKFPPKNDRRGFTMIELLITLVILGVIAGLTTPTYSRSVEESRVNEITVNLNSIYMGQKIYALNNNGNYWNPGANPTVASINSTLNLDINPKFYDITSITASNGTNPKTFLVVGTRNTTSGGDGTTTHSIDETGTVT